jgi:hypothetical protein
MVRIKRNATDAFYLFRPAFLLFKMPPLRLLSKKTFMSQILNVIPAEAGIHSSAVELFDDGFRLSPYRRPKRWNDGSRQAAQDKIQLIVSTVFPDSLQKQKLQFIPVGQIADDRHASVDGDADQSGGHDDAVDEGALGMEEDVDDFDIGALGGVQPIQRGAQMAFGAERIRRGARHIETQARRTLL